MVGPHYAAVLLHLINAQSLPVLLYGMAAIGLSQAELNSLNYAYNSVFCKIFKTSNANTILNCQYYSGNFNFTMRYEYIRYMFLNKLINKNRHVDKHAKVDESDMRDYNKIQAAYNLKSTDSVYKIKQNIYLFYLFISSNIISIAIIYK